MIPVLPDPDGVASDLAQLHRDRLQRSMVPEESPQGQIAALDAATDAVYAEMFTIMAGQTSITDPVRYETTLRDLAGQLVDLHAQAEAARDAAWAAQWERWGESK